MSFCTIVCMEWCTIASTPKCTVCLQVLELHVATERHTVGVSGLLTSERILK